MHVWTNVCLIAALCSMLYGIRIKAVGSGTRFYLVWIVFAAFFFLVAAGIRIQLWDKFPDILKGILLSGTGLFLLSFFLIEGFIIGQMHQKETPSLDYLLVLGAQMRENGPSAILKYRLDQAVSYLNENPDTIVIVSGGKGANEPCPEAEGMQQYLLAHGIKKVRILMETQSKTTAENIKNSRPLIHSGSTVGLVTNNFHMFRALQIAKAQGLTGVSGISAPSKAFYLPNNMLREYFAEIKFLLMKVM